MSIEGLQMDEWWLTMMAAKGLRFGDMKMYMDDVSEMLNISISCVK